MTRQQSPSDSSNSKSNGRQAASADGARGNLSVREAGRKGGLRVRELIQRGRMIEQREKDQQQRH